MHTNDLDQSQVERRRSLVIAFVLVIVTFVLYGRVAGHEFLTYDDGAYIVENPWVRDGLSWSGLKWAFTEAHASNWHPVTWLSHMLDCEMFGLEPGPHHLVSVGLHAACAVLLFFALRWMTAATWPSAWVAAIFALHPLRVESVAWAAERKDLLAGLFWMLTLVAWTAYAKRQSTWRYVPVVVCLALGLMSKPMLVTLPFALLLLDVWPLKRWRQVGGDATIGRLVVEKLPLLALSVASSALTVWSQRGGGAMGELPAARRLANAVLSYGMYLWKTVWPSDLAVFYPHADQVGENLILELWLPAALSLVLLLGVTAWVLVHWRARPYLAVGWLWYLGTLVPVIGLVQVGSQAHADRYTYIPLIGLYVAVAWWALDLWRDRPRVRGLLLGAGIASVVLAGAVTWAQTAHWRNSETLFRHALSVTRRNYVAYNNLGAIYQRRGEPERAEQHYRDALAVFPRYADAHANLGALDQERGRHEDARRALERAVEINPRHDMAHYNLGRLALMRGALDEAERELKLAVEIAPMLVEAHTNLGVVYARSGRIDDAAAAFGRALRFEPRHPAAHANLGRLEAGRERWTLAAEHYRIAIEAGLDDPRLHAGLAMALDKIATDHAAAGRGLPGQ